MPTVKEEMSEIKTEVRNLNKTVDAGFKNTNAKLDSFDNRFDKLPDNFITRREHEASQKASRNYVSTIVPLVGVAVTIAIAILTTR